MAKQTVGYLGGFQGTLGPAIGYMWNGKWCVRSKPGVVRNPRTPEQVAQREMFKHEVQLAADLGETVVRTMREQSREMGMTSYNLFVHVNQHAFSMVPYSSTNASRRSPSPSLGEESGVFTVDWAKLRLSIGDVPPVEAPRMTMTEDNVLEISFEKGHGYSHDQVFAVVYAPGLNNSFMSYPAFRRDKHISIALPNNFAHEELKVWLLVESPDNRWSEAAYVENEELGVRNEELEEGVAYSSTTAERRSPSPTLGEELGMRAAPPE